MNDYEHFGIPDGNLRAAEKAGERKRRHPYHTHVPTRNEVATLEPIALRSLLTGWMCHAATEIIPSRTQIFEVREILLTRVDTLDLAGLIAMCDCYIKGE